MTEFKKSGKRRNVRRKRSSSSSEDCDGGSSVVRGEKRKDTPNPLKSQSCTFKRVKPVMPTSKPKVHLLTTIILQNMVHFIGNFRSKVGEDNSARNRQWRNSNR